MDTLYLVIILLIIIIVTTHKTSNSDDDDICFSKPMWPATWNFDWGGGPGMDRHEIMAENGPYNYNSNSNND